MKVLRLVERMTKGVTGLDDNSNREVKSLRVLGEVKMMTLNEIYKTNEIDGIPVTLLGIENITGVGGTHESGIPCLVADIVARDFTNKGYAVDDVKWNFS